MVIYWGQNSAGSFTNVPSEQEQPLRHYCQDSSYDIIVVGFVYLFPSAAGNTDPTLPGMNFANHCEVPFSESNPFVLNCTANIAPDIQYCQSVGKKIFLSFGGGVGTYGFTSDAQAITFANTVWNMFLGGNGSIRPFGNAIFDGVDLDIEGGAQTGYISFISTLRSYFAQSTKTYYISSAPQCFYPDRLGPGAGSPLTEAWFDYVWIQFYNNWCGLNDPANFNFAQWVTGMANSTNPNVKLFIGAPASAEAAASGYVDFATLTSIATTVATSFPNNYGGIMMWDASTSDLNDDFAVTVATFVHSQNSVLPPSPPTVIATPSTTSVVAEPITTGRTKTSPPASPSTTGSVPVVVTPPVVTPPVVTPPALDSSSSTSSESDGSCTIGYMKCLTANTYSTCSHNVWGVAQACGLNTVCSPSGDYIYCVASTTPISPIISTPTPVVTPVPTPVAPTPVVPLTTSSVPIVISPTPTPVPVAPTPVPVVPTPAPVTPTPSVSVGSCSVLGYQQCTGTSTYQTCSNGRNGYVWSTAQSCQTGLSCHPSATANNIYCY